MLVISHAAGREPAAHATGGGGGGGGGVTVLPVEPSAFVLDGAGRHLARAHVEDVNGKPFDKSIRVTTTAAPAGEDDVRLVAPTTEPVRAGDVLLARFWLRCHASLTGEGLATFAFESAEVDGDGSRAAATATAAEFRVGADGEWRQVHVPFRAPRDYAAGAGRAVFRAGFDRQTIDVGGIELINYGPGAEPKALPRTRVSYAGRDPAAPWRREALSRIDAIRKGELAVRVTDASGKPVAGATVRATLRRHAFGFGSAVTVEHLLGDFPDARQYRQVVERLFNTAVFENDMKWPGNYGAIRPEVDTALDWLLTRGFRVRGHNLLWPSWRWLPEELRPHRNDPDELRRRTCQRLTRAVGHFKGRLVHWDVVNEPYSERDLLDALGWDVMVEWFRLAKRADPACGMYLNDYGIFDGGTRNEHRDHFYDTIRFLLDRGAPVDGVGIQSHFCSILPSPQRLEAVLDRFAEFGLPIESTELSLNLDDRALQADYMRDYLTALFSHPRVTGVMLWGFWAGRHWRPEAALWERDWTPRPVAEAWIDQVHRQWHTDATVTTDRDGLATVRGFLGDYDVLVSTPDGARGATGRIGRAGDGGDDDDRGGAGRVDVVLGRADRGGQR